MLLDSGKASGDYFTLASPTDVTPCLSWGEEASAVESALRALSEFNTDATKVAVSRSGGGTVDSERQRIVLTANTFVTDSSDGCYKLMISDAAEASGYSLTECLDYHTSGADMQAALTTALGLVYDEIIVTRTGDGSAAYGYGYIYQLGFTGATGFLDTSNLLGTSSSFKLPWTSETVSAEELATASAQTCAWTPIKKDRLHAHAPCTLMAPFLSDVDQLVLGDCTGGDWLHTCLPVTGRTIPSQTLTT